jgi:hypothetical protein
MPLTTGRRAIDALKKKLNVDFPPYIILGADP